MDMLENKKIREKINELDTLPDTYHHNIASKWSLLEVSLDGTDKRKRFAWKRIAVAAALIMLVGSSLLFFNYNNYKSTSQVSKKSSVIKNASKEFTLSEANVPGMTELQPEQKIKKDLQPLKKHSGNKHKAVVPIKKEEDKIAAAPVDSIVQPIIPKTETGLLTTITPKRKKPRFVELDFNDNVIIDKPAETWAFRKIKFQTGADRLSFHEVNGKMIVSIPIF